jgi:uncharacterized protein (DUF362 family)
MIRFSRRQFLKLFALGATGMIFNGFFSRLGLAQLGKQKFNGRTRRNIKTDHDLVAVKGDDPAAITRKAIESLGGMQKFVKPGATVLIKPNIGWDRAPEFAANTNPAVVATLVELCFSSGAKRVNVFDNTCNAQERCYENSGIKKAAEAKGARVYFTDSWNVVKAHFPFESTMENWPIFRDAIECDTFINVPVLKHHGSTKLTLGMKNLMGVCGGNRGLMHVDLGTKIFEVTQFIVPDLTVIDSYRYLNLHGPSGGDLKDVELRKTVIASSDYYLADVFASRFVDIDPNTIPYIARAIDKGLCSPDLTGKDILELTI